MKVRRIGVLGGTFDPFHNGHLAAAVNARHQARLDVVLVMVANDPWQKSGDRAVSAAADRLAMVQAGVDGVEGVEASDLEIRRGGATYTADTLAELAELHPGAELFVVLGADLVTELGSWRRTDEIAARAGLVVVNRPGHVAPVPPGWQVENVEMPDLAISSTDLRARAADGRPLDGLVCPEVIRLAAERSLYAGRT